MLSAAVWPWRCATTQCSTRIAAALCGSGQRAMSPAAKIPGALVSRYSLTVTPRSIARPAFSASASRGRTPTPTTTKSAPIVPPLFSVTWRASIAVAVRDLARTYIDCGDGRLQPQVDALFGVEAVCAQRDPLLRRVAGQVILGQVRPVHGRRVVVAQHHNAALVALAAQHLGGGETGRAAADNHDLLRRSGRRCDTGARCRHQLLPHEHLVVSKLSRPARDGTERRRAQRFAGPQAEAGVVPRAAHSVVDHQPFRERTVVVGTAGADRDELVAATEEQAP